jgi:hypothetical protein
MVSTSGLVPTSLRLQLFTESADNALFVEEKKKKKEKRKKLKCYHLSLGCMRVWWNPLRLDPSAPVLYSPLPGLLQNKETEAS